MTDFLSNLLKGYGSYITGAVGIVYGGGSILDVWNNGGPVWANVLITVVGFGLVFLRRALANIGLDIVQKVDTPPTT